MPASLYGDLTLMVPSFMARTLPSLTSWWVMPAVKKRYRSAEMTARPTVFTRGTGEGPKGRAPP